MCSNKKCSKVKNNNNIEGLCWHCNHYKKECLICKNTHFRQGKTCSLICTNELKSQTYMITCGTKHNFDNCIFKLS